QFHGWFPVQRQVDRGFGNFVIDAHYAVETPRQSTRVCILITIVAQATAKPVIPAQSFHINKIDGLVNFVETEQLKNGKTPVALEIYDTINSVAFIQKMLIGNPVCDAKPPSYRPNVTVIRFLS